jgi:hypothetical protein
MNLTSRSCSPSRFPAAARGTAVAAAVLFGLGFLACARSADDPILALLAKTLKRGDRAVLVRALDPQATRVAAVIETPAGKPELRFYEQKGPGKYALVHTTQQGDSFRNLSLEDVDGDGKDEVVTTWEGGHLEIVEVMAQGPDHAYSSILQNAGRQIEKRYDPAGRVEFWITSRTYAEEPGQSPAYATTVYRFSGGRYAEAPRN